VEDFIRNLRGIDEGADVDRESLLGIYERIRVSEFKPGSDHVTQVGSSSFAHVGAAFRC
jgi:IQ motif/SEC7 domain-containing protein